MKSKLRILLLLFVSIYALATTIGAMMVISDGTFHLGEWLFSGSLYPAFVMLYHILMISGCILVLSKKGELIMPKYVLVILALLLALSRLAAYVISLVPLLDKFRLTSPEVSKVLAEALIRPGGIIAEILLIVIVLILFYGSNSKGKTRDITLKSDDHKEENSNSSKV